ncbi:hypothetical protein [Arcticibacter sp. MXS-1]|uniref:hypothetical protein n=1 Tax=Arcticibacter sp. MXS-1 TaxID=3341726 RepID=UPI0035A97DD1
MGLKFVNSLTLPVLIVLIFSRSGFCQPSLAGSPIRIDQLETQIKKSISLTETKRQLDQLKRESQINGNYVLLARSIRAGITLRDRLTEDSLYFQNSAILDTLIASERTDQRLKPLLLLLRAQRISEFNKRRLTFNYATYSTKKLA